MEEITLAELLKPLDIVPPASVNGTSEGMVSNRRRQGFDVNVAGTFRGHPESYFGPFKLPRLEGGSAADYLTDRLTDAAVQFIEESAGRGPFFLYLPEFAVHLPLQARQALVEKYRERMGKRSFLTLCMRRCWIASTRQSEDYAPSSAERRGRETVFIVTSDNGGVTQPRITDNSPLRAGKGHLYEGGIREPLLVLWPGVTRPGTIINHPVTSIDYLPTVLEIVGGTRSESN